LRLFAQGLPVNRKRFSGQIIIASIDFTWTKIRAIKKDLETSGCFNLGLGWL